MFMPNIHRLNFPRSDESRCATGMTQSVKIININCYNWVESCAAIIKTYAGEFKATRWSEPLSSHLVGRAETRGRVTA
jgi:hypothetical protein